MAEKLDRQQVAAKAIIHADVAPGELAREATQVDRSFELPNVLYAATVGLFLAYLAVMGAGFAHPQLMLPMAVFVLVVIAGFGVPALWVRMNPENAQRALSWGEFVRNGIDTASGRLGAREATIQVLMLPALIFIWGVACVTIAAFAR